MQLIEVNTPELIQEFLLFPVKLYKKDPNYIRPLDKDIESVFDPKKNKLLRAGEAIRWVLRDEKGKAIGRVAAFINKKTANTYEQPTGGLGFFDCINNQQAANLLFNTSRDWLKARGMEAMDGPINFGDRDRWWGVLVDGFHAPTYCMNYNAPYYQQLFESYGFEVYFKQYVYYRTVEEKLEPEVYRKATAILENPDYHFQHISKKELKKYAEDFRTVYNKSWTKFEGVKSMSEAHAMSIMNQLKPVLDERIVWFGYYKNEPISFFICLPELNQLFKYTNGKLDWWGKLKFVYHRWKGDGKGMFGIVFGVVPDHQRKGVETAMVVASSKVIQNNSSIPYTEFQMNWIGDFNPKMMNVAVQVGGRIYKTYHTYRFLFDRTKEFKRMPILS